LTTLWFVVVAYLWVGYFLLEGFDFGVGALLRPIGRSEKGRRVLINTIGPVWDGNEVWVITAAGATFAAFPEWYASMFSAFYPILLLLLICLIVRGVGFEYRGKGHTDRWRARWDKAIILTSWGLAILWGVMFGSVVHGVPLDADHEFIGGWGDLVSPFAVATGIATLLLFLTHGAIYLALKTTAEVRERARRCALRTGTAAVVVTAVIVGWQYTIRPSGTALLAGAAAVLALVAALLITRAGRDGWAFVASATATVLLTAGWFLALYPDVLPSTLDPASSLTVDNSSSTAYTLTLMTWIAVVFAPVILGYEAWSYWVFRRRISIHHIPDSPHPQPHLDDTDDTGALPPRTTTSSG